MIFRCALLLVSSVMVLDACTQNKEWTSMKEYIGKEPMNIIHKASRAKAFYVASFPDKMETELESFEGYPILKGPIDLYEEELINLKEIVLNSGSYILNEEMKMCIFTPNVGVAFETDRGESVHMLLSFDCDVVKLIHAETSTFIEDVDPARQALQNLFVPIFKEEPYFQALK